MRRREQWSIGTGLVASYLVILVGMSVVCVMLISSIRHQAQITEDLFTHPYAVSKASMAARQIVGVIRNEVLFAIMSRNPKKCEATRNKVSELRRDLNEQLVVVEGYFLGDMGQVAEVRALDERWVPMVDNILSIGARGKFAEAEIAIIYDGTPNYEALISHLDYVVTFARDKAAFFAAEAKLASERTLVTSVFLLIGAVIVTLGIAALVTKLALHHLQQGISAMRLAGSVIDNTDQAVMVTRVDGTIISINPAFTQITGFSAEEAMGQTPRLLRSGLHESEFYQSMWGDLLSEGHWQGRLWNSRKDGETFLAWVTITTLREHGSPSHFISMFSDVTEHHREDETFRHRAGHDHLTGLPNRHVLDDRLTQSVVQAKRSGDRAAVMFIDWEGFKAVNDTLGHEMGDQVLIEVASRLKATLRRCDTVARLGGDEFVAILSGLPSSEEIATIADKIVSIVAQPIAFGGKHVTVGASIGIAIYPDDGADVVTLMRQADTAMYRAKREGKNTWRMADATLLLASENL